MDITHDDRARLTPVDIVFFGVAAFLLALMSNPVYQVLYDSTMGTGSSYLFQLMWPAMIVTVLTMIIITAASGR